MYHVHLTFSKALGGKYWSEELPVSHWYYYKCLFYMYSVLIWQQCLHKSSKVGAFTYWSIHVHQLLPRQVALGKISNMNYENLHQDLWIGICHIMSSWAVIRISAKIAEIEPVRLTINWQRLTLAAPIRRKNFFFLSSSPKSTPSQLLAEWTYDNINTHLILAFGYMFVLANWNIFQVIQLKKIQ